MTSEITTLDPRINSLSTKAILSDGRYYGTLLSLAPGDETPPLAANRESDLLLFIIDGEATVRRGEVNTVLSLDQALVLHHGEEAVVAASANRNTKILRLEIPPRQVVTPQIITLSR